MLYNIMHKVMQSIINRDLLLITSVTVSTVYTDNGSNRYHFALFLHAIYIASIWGEKCNQTINTWVQEYEIISYKILRWTENLR
jgi:hypothetical protein